MLCKTIEQNSPPQLPPPTTTAVCAVHVHNMAAEVLFNDAMIAEYCQHYGGSVSCHRTTGNTIILSAC